MSQQGLMRFLSTSALESDIFYNSSHYLAWEYMIGSSPRKGGDAYDGIRIIIHNDFVWSIDRSNTVLSKKKVDHP